MLRAMPRRLAIAAGSHLGPQSLDLRRVDADRAPLVLAGSPMERPSQRVAEPGSMEPDAMLLPVYPGSAVAISNPPHATRPIPMIRPNHCPIGIVFSLKIKIARPMIQ
jgi:hypothetical protein